ncbi:LLM class flavin-dependent oxidoreductase [Rhizorhabdus wittichii]|uniref:LLM class flavin-dependent oxidoreductase n=1 Tax=Rhizorhabdus wittichii TaxID=160791 RepID=A0A975D4U1_9SPHN|nr:LLM class flavin-dependent oxidoreductase [Rhizorhabdus wittichii]QTH21700.1 LLM class flavin-dependent oxidoreductase [Rhizorhabdus wittichii]
MIKPNPLIDGTGFKIGTFASNADGGLSLATVPERWQARWDDCLTAARIADRAGLDFLLPIARWRGFGGEIRAREWSFETFTWAAALAAVTKRIGVLMTVHVPVLHPLYVAKALATVDHVAHGRAGLNIVCGWNPEEFAMFGIALDADGYAMAEEWLDVIERLYTASGPIDHHGRFYTLNGAVSRPASVQAPRPPVINAAFSARGRQFALSRCDRLFTVYIDAADLARQVREAETVAAAGRSVGLFTTAHVVCRGSAAEAEDYYRRVTVEQIDEIAVDNHMRDKARHTSADEYQRYRQRFAGGAGTAPLVGTPAQIADQLIAIAATGCRGIALSFVNYAYELPHFCDRVLPLLERAGLRP